MGLPLLFLSTAAICATHYVPDDFGTIQAALDGATEGDEIIVRDGTYTGAGNKNLNFRGKALTLRSENGPENCIIDCEQSGRGFRFRTGERNTSVMEGFTVTNGRTFYDNWGIGGAGILCENSYPTITNCIITNCFAWASDGGGIYCDALSSPAISNCTIAGNWSEFGGGGISSTGSSMSLLNCTISGNSTSRSGGGIACGGDSPATISGCVITGNIAALWAGGISIGGASSINNCIISQNLAGESGGGMVIGGLPEACLPTNISRIDNCHPTANNCVIQCNRAVKNGGGIYVANYSAVAISKPILTHCAITGNHADGFGGGICSSSGSDPDIKSCIIWRNEATQGSELALVSTDIMAELTISYSDVEGGLAAVYADAYSNLKWGYGMIDSDPMFVSPSYWDGEQWVVGDCHLLPGSPCIDAGIKAGVSADFDGDIRPQGHGYDIGIDEIPYSGPCVQSTFPVREDFHRDGGDGSIEVETPAGCEWTSVSNDSWITINAGSVGVGGGTVLYSVSPNTTDTPRTGTISVGTKTFTVGQERGIGDTYYVPDDFPTIQEALDAALDADTIMVRDGTYTGAGNKNLDFLGKALTLRSENGPENCIIDCENSGRGFYFHTDEWPDSVLDGFTIVNGNAPVIPLGLHRRGGGICCRSSSPTIVNCIIQDCFVPYAYGGPYGDGGGISLAWSSAIIRDCLIRRNEAVQGGGLFLMTSDAIIKGCNIRDNYARIAGGGIYLFYLDLSEISDCLISYNSTEEGWRDGIMSNYSAPIISDCVVNSNGGDMGTGITVAYPFERPVVIKNCQIYDHGSHGIFSTGDPDSPPTIANCIIAGSPWAIYISRGGANSVGGANIVNCTLVENSLYAVDIPDPSTVVSMTNCILWGNDRGPFNYAPPGLTVTYSNIEGGFPGEGNIDLEPLFVWPGHWEGDNWIHGDYHLQEDSPCIDSGTDAGIYDDIDEEVRPWGNGFDMGADEYSVPPPEISLSTHSLNNSCSIGSNASDQTFSVWNSGEYPLSYTITDDVEWLECSPSSGTSVGEQDTITVTYATSGLDIGSYTATITVEDPNASNSPQQIEVTLDIIYIPVIARSPSVLNTSCGYGENPPQQTFQVWNSGTGTISYSLSDTADWLACSPTSGTSAGEADTIAIDYDTSGLGVGSYAAIITIDDPGAANNPKYVNVFLTVIPNQSLSQIDLRAPANESLLQSPPAFTWAADGGTGNRYAVDVAFSVYGPWYSTWEHLHHQITGNSWTMPQGVWNKIRPGTYVYWRVRGEDFDQAGLNIVYAREIWWFYKR